MTHRDGLPRFSVRSVRCRDVGHRKACATPSESPATALRESAGTLCLASISGRTNLVLVPRQRKPVRHQNTGNVQGTGPELTNG